MKAQGAGETYVKTGKFRKGGVTSVKQLRFDEWFKIQDGQYYTTLRYGRVYITPSKDEMIPAGTELTGLLEVYEAAIEATHAGDFDQRLLAAASRKPKTNWQPSLTNPPITANSPPPAKAASKSKARSDDPMFSLSARR